VAGAVICKLSVDCQIFVAWRPSRLPNRFLSIQFEMAYYPSEVRNCSRPGRNMGAGVVRQRLEGSRLRLRRTRVLGKFN
jgi:hypothetical protein